MQKFKVLVLIAILFLCQGAAFVIDAKQNAVSHNEKGLYFMELGYYGSAIDEFFLAINLNPNSEVTASFYNNLGTAYYKIGDYYNAEKSFQNALKIQPLYINYFKSLIMTNKQLGKLASLCSKYEQMLIDDKYNLQAYLMLGLIQKEYGNKQLAVDYLTRFVRLAPELRVTREVKGIIKEINKKGT